MDYWRTRGLMAVAGVIVMLAAVSLGAFMGFPGGGVMHPSAMLQPSPGMALAGLGVVLAVGMVVGVGLAGRVRPEAGLAAALLGWVVLSWRSGALHDALFAAPVAGTYGRLAVEVAVLGGMLAVAQGVIRVLVGAGWVRSDLAADGVDLPGSTLGQRVGGMLAVAAIYVALTWFLLPVDDKVQAIFGSAVAGFAAVAAVHYYLAVDIPAWCLWPGVLLGAAAAEAYAGMNPGVPAIGVAVVPTVRALPIDHASAGVIGALMGYWDARRWRRPEGAGERESAAASLVAGAVEAGLSR